MNHSMHDDSMGYMHSINLFTILFAAIDLFTANSHLIHAHAHPVNTIEFLLARCNSCNNKSASMMQFASRAVCLFIYFEI